MLLVPCIALGANSHKQSMTNAALTSTAESRTVKAQAPVTGIVKDETGAPLAGVTVFLKGTSEGTTTDVNGKFTINATPGAILVFSYIGYLSKQITVGNDTNYAITLTSDTKNLNEVVVTALGIKRESKTLTYGTQTISGNEVNEVKDPSFVNALAGKIAGATISESASGAGGSTRVVLRGEKSISGDNSVLYVIDGIPMPKNQSGQPGSIFGGQDGGDAISAINSDDIESITVLPGAASTALYGSDGANGVILITTKKGVAGKTSINFSSNTTFQTAVDLPKLQTEYGQGSADTSNTGVLSSWGAKTNQASYNPKSFFNTGKTFINSINVSTGTEKNQTYFSFQSTNDDGIEPNNKLDKYNFTVRNTSQLLNNKLTLDVSANYIQQNTFNRPVVGFYYNPLVTAYLFPRGVDFTPYKTYETPDPARGDLPVQNWPAAYYLSDIGTANPYWLVNRDNTVENQSRILGTVSAKYQITDWLSLQGRGKVDRTNDVINQDFYATSPPVLVGPKGAYRYIPTDVTQTYGDLILSVNKKFSDFTLTANLGGVIQNNQSNGLNIGGNLSQYDNLFTVRNLDVTSLDNSTQNTDRQQTQSLFATANLGYKDYLFLDVSGRNDWNSTLAYTNNLSFFYPAAGLNLVLSQLAKMPEPISFLKIRGSVADVGSGLDQNYLTTTQYPFNGNTVAPTGLGSLQTLKPQKSLTTELGVDSRFFNDQLSFSANVYKTNTTNQLITVNAPSSALYSTQIFNAGKVTNRGIEITMGYNAKFNQDFSWNPSVNFSANRNKVVSLLTYTDPTTGKTVKVDSVLISNSAYDERVQVGGSFGDMYLPVVQRDANGNVVTGTNGLPLRNPVEQRVGNYNPNFNAGFENTFKYKRFSLSFLVDGRFGGQVISGTQAVLDQYGVSETTAQARDAGGVMVNGKLVDAQAYYTNQGGRAGILGQYVYSATNVRLRELTFGYTIPGSVMNNAVKSITIRAVARNLFFFTNKAPFDPDLAYSTDNGSQGFDMFNLPSVRSYGINLSASF